MDVSFNEDKSALFPSTNPKAPNKIDLPAPVSPVIIERPEEKENLQENIKTLQYSAKYLRSLINNILLFNKVDHMEDYDLDDFEFSIREVVKNAVESSKHLNQLAPSTYKIDINEAIPEKIRGDEVKLTNFNEFNF